MTSFDSSDPKTMVICLDGATHCRDSQCSLPHISVHLAIVVPAPWFTNLHLVIILETVAKLEGLRTRAVPECSPGSSPTALVQPSWFCEQ